MIEIVANLWFALANQRVHPFLPWAGQEATTHADHQSLDNGHWAAVYHRKFSASNVFLGKRGLSLSKPLSLDELAHPQRNEGTQQGTGEIYPIVIQPSQPTQ